MNDTTVVNANFPKVEKIGEGAFSYCTNLQTANFPKCSQLGGSAFYYCGSLTTAYFPKVSSFGVNAFNNCVNLTSIEAPLLESVDGYTFANCSKLSEANFPLLTTIGSQYDYYAFASTAIKSAYFPLVSFVCKYAFVSCKSLTTANLANVMKFEDGVFTYCTSLETVTLGAYSYSSITNPANLFYGCTNLKSIYVPSGALNYYQTDSRWSYWSDKIVPYDESDEYIYPYEYANNTEITEIPLNKQNAINLGYNAFLRCTNLRSVNLPNCRSIYSGVFSSHLSNSIEYVNIGVSWLKDFDFRDCSKLREVYAPNLVGYDSQLLFMGCGNLEIVSLPSLKILRNFTFDNSTKLKTVYLYSLEIWNTEPFRSCSSLESVYIGSNVTYVGDNCIPTNGSAKIYVPNDMVDTYKNGLFSSYSSMIYGY